MDKFWIVWNPSGHNPQYRHDSEQSANNEAKRLAKQNPDHEFFVCEVKARAFVETVKFETLNEPCPF